MALGAGAGSRGENHALRRVVLAEVAHVINTFRRSSLWSSTTISEEDDPIIQNLKVLQSRAREAPQDLTPGQLLFPFCEVVRAPYLSAPYKAAALDAMRALFTSNLMVVDSAAEDAMSEVVDSIATCKFVQTDKVADELVQLSILQTLQTVLKTDAVFALADDSLWDVIETLYNHSVETHRSEMLRSVAEHTVLIGVQFIFAHLKGGSNPNSTRARFGLPCAVKVMGFFCSKLQHFAKRSSNPLIEKNTSLRSFSFSRSMSTLTQISTDNSTLDNDTVTNLRLLKLSLTVLRVALESGGFDLFTCRALCDMIRQDLGESVVLLTAGGYPLEILRLCLDIFYVIFENFMPVVRPLVEAMLVHVFLRSLHQLSQQLVREEELKNDVDVVSHGDATVAGQPRLLFTFEERDMIISALVDLLSHKSAVPTLFLNFDCHPERPSIIEPMIKYATQVQSTLIDPACSALVQSFLATLVSRCNTKFESEEPSKAFLPQIQSRIAASVRNKAVWKEGATRFEVKPRQGLKFLESKFLLQTPLQAAEVAMFLRRSPFLDKGVVGEYLGVLGEDVAKDPTAYEGDTQQFHKDALRSYCRTFPFTGQPLLICLRVFLSAFLLPREAQQIDRILLAFAEHAHNVCIEGLTGVLESDDVTYLLTVSLIMLNTDLHNPNIRPDRKMTIEQFVRNNTNYGADLKQTRPLPPEFLEALYKSILECPIRTEGNNADGLMTEEEWSDMQLQMAQDAASSAVLTFHISEEDLKRYHHSLLIPGPNLGSACSGDMHQQVDTLSYAFEKDVLLGSPRANVFTTYDAFDSSTNLRAFVSHPLEWSCMLCGHDWIVDAELLRIVWRHLVALAVAGLSVDRLSTALVTEGSNQSAQALTPSAAPFIGPSVDILLGVLKAASANGMSCIIDTVLFLLCDLTGLSSGMSDGILMHPVSPDSSNGISHLNCPLLQPVLRTSSQIGRIGKPGESILQLVASSGARTSLVVLFHIAHNFVSDVRRGWVPVVHAMCALRDLHLLPSTVVNEQHEDLIPSYVRQDFHYLLSKVASGNQEEEAADDQTFSLPKSVLDQTIASMDSWDGRAVTVDQRILQRNSQTLPAQSGQAISMFSFRALTEMMFGTWDDPAQEDPDFSPETPLMSLAQLGKWDEGYEHIPVPRTPTVTTEPSEDEPTRESPFKETLVDLDVPPEMLSDASVFLPVSEIISVIRDLEPAITSTPTHVDSDNQELATTILITLRMCRIDDLLRETKFMSDVTLLWFMRALLLSSHAADFEDDAGMTEEYLAQHKYSVNAALNEGIQDSLAIVATNSASQHSQTEIDAFVARHESLVPIPSCSSVGMCEVLGTSMALRSRDRIATMWPALMTHYKLAFTKIRKPSYVFERRVVGLLRLLVKLAGRRKGPLQLRLVEALGLLAEKGANGVSSCALRAVAPQVATGLWLFFTANEAAVEDLEPKHWDLLLGLVCECGRVGGYASIKTFEIMVLLMQQDHVCAVKQLHVIESMLGSARVPKEVAMGCVKLLRQMSHKAGPSPPVCIDTSTLSQTHDTPVSWLQILETISRAALDVRVDVQRVCVSALATCFMDIDDAVSSLTPGPEMIATALVDIMTTATVMLAKNALRVSKEQHKGEAVQIHNDASASEVAQDDDLGTAGAALEGLTLLCKCVLRHLQDIRHFPIFHKLWLRLLYLFGIFLGAPYASDWPANSAEWSVASETALELLKNVLLVVANMNLFQAVSEGPVLWALTWSYVTNFMSCDHLLLGLFPHTSPDVPPSLQEKTVETTDAQAPDTNTVTPAITDLDAHVLPSDDESDAIVQQLVDEVIMLHVTHEQPEVSSEG